ncbi:NADH:ubiquinone oxidoreductase subunit NDUFA12 [Sphingorhabdus arenilitoris]|uniref:NADH:ubiquinone oxidoreductase subunit NDUFA12 n=1 Tax=Sphingorhabdus arenilitoris TaxID=1490041 RepID=A0ABV8RJR3_9SPHN
MGILAKIFTWWDGATIGTLLFSARKGLKVGTDETGNVYYQSKDGLRRWVIYNGANDASRVSPDWHGWLHGTHDGNPEDYLPPARGWEHGSDGNLTGTAAAYRPAGALESSGKRARATGDYEAWSPSE